MYSHSYSYEWNVTKSNLFYRLWQIRLCLLIQLKQNQNTDIIEAIVSLEIIKIVQFKKTQMYRFFGRFHIRHDCWIPCLSTMCPSFPFPVVGFHISYVIQCPSTLVYTHIQIQYLAVETTCVICLRSLQFSVSLHCCRTHPWINRAHFNAMPVVFFISAASLPQHVPCSVKVSALLEYEGFRGDWRHQPTSFFHASCELYPQTFEPCPKPLFKHSQARFVKCARAQNACVHTNKWTGSWGQACLDPGPGPLCENMLSSLGF